MRMTNNTSWAPALETRCDWRVCIYFAVFAVLWLGIARPGMAHQIIQITTNSAVESDVRIDGDSFRRLHVTYVRDGELYYQCRFYDGSSLTLEEHVTYGASYSLALDPTGNPHVLSVSSGTVHYAVRTNGTWISNPIGSADGASLAIMEDGQPYVAFARTETNEQWRSYSSIYLARIETNTLVPFHVIAAGYETKYNCLGRQASEHHNYSSPMLRCSHGVFHIVGRHVQTRDAYIEHATFYCNGESKPRMGYWRYDLTNQSSSFSEYSSYPNITSTELNFTLLPDGQPQLAYYFSNGAWNYSGSLDPWVSESLSSGIFNYSWGMRPIDASSRGVVGLLTHNSFGKPLLHLRIGGIFTAGVPVYTQAVSSDLCLDLSAIAFIQAKESNSTDVYLLVNLDSDGDSLSDRDEGVAGTDPFNNNSVFKWEKAEVNPDNGIYSYDWHGVEDRLYTLYFTTNWGFSWTNLVDYTDLPGQNAPIVISNPASGLSQAWVRVGVRVTPWSE